MSSINRILNSVLSSFNEFQLLNGQVQLMGDEEELVVRIVNMIQLYDLGDGYFSSDDELFYETSEDEYHDGELNAFSSPDSSFNDSLDMEMNSSIDSNNSSARQLRLEQRNEQKDEESANNFKRRKIDDNFVPNDQQIEDRKLVRTHEKFSKDTIKKIYDYHQKIKRTEVAKNVKKSSAILKTKNKFQSYELTSNHVRSIIYYVEEGGCDFEKYKQIKDQVFEKFMKAREEHQQVNDIDICNWIRMASNQFKPKKKCLSKSFFESFKREYRISSRRVTKFVQSGHLESEEDRRDRSELFVSETTEWLDDNGLADDNVWNSDQSRFEKEMYCNRTYANVGDKTVLSQVVRVDSTKHSYTIQPSVSKSGKLAKKLYICLQESTGNKFGPQIAKKVEECMMQYTNLHIECSKSGKLNKNPQLWSWFKTFANENFDYSQNVIILDSWSAHKDEEGLRKIVDKPFSLFIIPDKTTCFIQPLDVVFFRQYKIFARRMTNFIRKFYFDNEETKPDNRYWIFKMHSLIYNQFQAPAFLPLLRYCFIKAGYSPKDEGYNFLTVNQLLFKNLKDCSKCESISFIRCAYCGEEFCFKCFCLDNNFHFHQE